MVRKNRWPLLLVFAATNVLLCVAQMPANLTGKPFVAQRTHTTHSSKGVITETGTIARRSDGTTYLELKDSDGRGLVLIFDIVHHQAIELNLTYHFYTISEDAKLQPQTWPQQYEQHFVSPQDEPGSKRTLDGGWKITTIGRRDLDGIATVGYSEKKTNGRTIERWYSPAIDMNVESSQHDPENGAESKTQLQRIRLVEPDAKLFEVPQGFVAYKDYKGAGNGTGSPTP